jgi:hypothetical protein
MSWIELDDQMLEHPKFIRAVKIAGSDVVFLWLGLRAYCSQKLTDGAIPSDMMDEVRGPREPRRRSAALAALVTVGLVDQLDDGAHRLHDYLDWSSSREEVLKRRSAAADRKRRSRGTEADVTAESRRDYQRSHAVTTSGVTRESRAESQTPARADPLPSPPLPSPPIQIGGDPERVPEIWPPSEWLKKFGAAWQRRWNNFYGQAGDSKACGTMADMLEKLPREEILRCQERAAEMFSEFLAGTGETAIARKHPFAFFVGDFGTLRIGPKPAATTSGSPALDRAVAQWKGRGDR